MKETVKAFIRTCPICNERKGDSRKAPLAPEPRVGRPFQRIGIDFAELGLTKNGNRYVFVVIDHASKFVEALACDNEKAETAADFIFSNIICRYGAPVEILSDRGKAFTGKVLTLLSKMCGIEQKFTAGYHPQTNGLTERFNRTLEEMLSKFVNPQLSNWDELLPSALFAYNTSVHSSTGYSPFEMIHGFTPRMPIETSIVLQPPKAKASEWVKSIHQRAEVLQEAGLVNQERHASNQAKQYNKGKTAKSIKVGDLVRVNMSQKLDPASRKLSRVWKGPFRVIKRIGKVSYRLADLDGRELQDAVHANRIMLANDERQE